MKLLRQEKGYGDKNCSGISLRSRAHCQTSKKLLQIHRYVQAKAWKRAEAESERIRTFVVLNSWY